MSQNNLIPISPQITYDSQGSPISGVWQLTHGVPPDGATLIHLDFQNAYNSQPSIRLDPYTPETNNPARETDVIQNFPINGGDTFILKAVMKTTPSQYGTQDGGGIRIAFDFFDDSGVINIDSADPQLANIYLWGNGNSYVPWGSDWTTRKLTIHVPLTMTDNQGNTRTPKSIGVWAQIWGSTLGDPATNTGLGWLAAPELYIYYATAPPTQTTITINTTINPTGAGTVDFYNPTQAIGTTMTITAYPTQGWTFQRWLFTPTGGTTALLSSGITLTFPFQLNGTIEADFLQQNTPPPPPVNGYCHVLRAIGYTDVEIQKIRELAHKLTPEPYITEMATYYQKYGQDWAALLKNEPDLMAWLKEKIDFALMYAKLRGL
jgi:hypothetical protein